MKTKHPSHSLSTIIILAFISFVGLSCEKVVDIDLNSSDPHIVIEGSISDVSPCVVTLSQTVNFNEPNTFPPISGAAITLLDDLGNIDSLTEIQPGIYHRGSIPGKVGRTYTLTVSVDGKEYVATSTMPKPVRIDSLRFSTLTFGRNTSKIVNVFFQDPPNEKNYYRFIEMHNGDTVKNIFLYDDRIQDGNLITVSLYADNDTLRTGDIVLVILQCIDKGVYDYFRTIRLASGGGGPQAASPANPISNFSNGALGYFSAYSEWGRVTTVP